jgi:hypothetical protein
MCPLMRGSYMWYRGMFEFQMALCVGVLVPERGGLCCPVETEANGDSRSTYERGPSLVGSLGSSCQCKRFLSCLGCSSQPSTKYLFSSLHTISLHLFPSPSKLGRQSCRVTFLFIMCLWSVHYCIYINSTETSQPIKYKNPLRFSLQGGEGRRLRIWRRLFFGSRRVIYARRLTAHTSMTIISLWNYFSIKKINYFLLDQEANVILNEIAFFLSNFQISNICFPMLPDPS